MKKWRRRGGLGGATQAPGPVLTEPETDILQADGTYFGAGGLFIHWEESPNGADGWAEVQFDAVTADPMSLDIAAVPGPFFRARIAFGGGVFSAWSNVYDNSP